MDARPGKISPMVKVSTSRVLEDTSPAEPIHPIPEPPGSRHWRGLASAAAVTAFGFSALPLDHQLPRARPEMN
jgi:hypothetical protein